jgi:hypothetical protein
MKRFLLPLAFLGLVISPMLAEEQGPPPPGPQAGPGHEGPGAPGADRKGKRPPPVFVAIRVLEETVKALENAPDKDAKADAIASCKETLGHLKAIAETMPKPHGKKKAEEGAPPSTNK